MCLLWCSFNFLPCGQMLLSLNLCITYFLCGQLRWVLKYWFLSEALRIPNVILNWWVIWVRWLHSWVSVSWYLNFIVLQELMIWGLSNSNIQIVPMKYNPRDENSIKAVMAKANVVINLIGSNLIFDIFFTCNCCILIVFCIYFKQEGNMKQEITVLRKWTIRWLNSLLLYVSIFHSNYAGLLFHYLVTCNLKFVFKFLFQLTVWNYAKQLIFYLKFLIFYTPSLDMQYWLWFV